MGKTTKVREDKKMAGIICREVSDAGKIALQKSVEKIIRQNKKVFDNLAKS